MNNLRYFFLAVLLLPHSVSGQARYDILLKGGHVIDAKNAIDAVRDVAIAGGKIAAIAPQIPAARGSPGCRCVVVVRDTRTRRHSRTRVRG